MRKHSANFYQAAEPLLHLIRDAQQSAMVNSNAYATHALVNMERQILTMERHIANYLPE